MTMLRCVEFERFRRFQRYRLAGLARVNLLVGDNNCGKTSLLEGVSLLATGGAPWALANLAWSRGEIVDDVSPRLFNNIQSEPDISHFFCGHKLLDKMAFVIRDCDQSVELDVAPHRSMYGEPEPWGLGITLRKAGPPPSETKESCHITENGVLRDMLRPALPMSGSLARVQFLSLSPRNAPRIGALWDLALKQRREAEVAEALRILEPSLENIVFLTSESAARYGGAVGVFVGIEGQKERVPLASMGDGMYRLLELALALVQTSGGVLLVDEIDTGLHYSILADVWRLIVTAARQWDVQVFATTHSFDCIRGLAWLCHNHPDLAEDVALHKIEPKLDESVSFDAEHIKIAVGQGIEVR